ncbi:3-galactosyl-N-acetylglucosaminide 4-alpha-L-fucosyltransferase FUT3-like [Spea bombifrons]|uniref:3-galactosyl-N-acetylglucosaminide 4-alpha-L-fucosyltransferase FUT3-like n=1 Tax=Spea bombifrons TaxID=233779 RepID=UPI00234AB44E|nr:3-galactosyl-N-acetylglucosaminide 4-alpha-L-fucosyltransferase FUT3-like [Spea bombifrons]
MKVPVEGVTEPNKVILLWTWPFGNRFPLNQCPNHLETSGCLFTDNRELYYAADAVVIHHRDVCSSKIHLPQMPRNGKQYWIWFNLESPTHSRNLQLMNKLFNLTMSYRTDSDIFVPYGYLKKHSEIQNFTIPAKTSLVAWVVSNWNPQSRRVKFYEELKKHLTVDIYGKQHLPLPNDKKLEVLSKYKFYLSFENSVHQDYITEKLWQNALKSGTVPVVMGPPRENYERFIPPDSFIHVDDFSSPQELATYLLELDKDDKRYQQYFNWRTQFKSNGTFDWAEIYCRVCTALKDSPAYRTVPSIDKWFK